MKLAVYAAFAALVVVAVAIVLMLGTDPKRSSSPISSAAPLLPVHH